MQCLSLSTMSCGCETTSQSNWQHHWRLSQRRGTASVCTTALQSLGEIHHKVSRLRSTINEHDLQHDPGTLRIIPDVQHRIAGSGPGAQHPTRCLSWVWTPKTDGIKGVWADRTLLWCYPSDIDHYRGGNPTGAGISPLDFHCRW